MWNVLPRAETLEILNINNMCLTGLAEVARTFKLCGEDTKRKIMKGSADVYLLKRTIELEID